MDVVYVVAQGDGNDELRHSLRSLAKNLPHDRVWLAGHRPKWVVNAEWIPVKQYGRKWANSTANLLTACAHPEVSEHFYLFNDDFFILEPMDEFPVLHRGPVHEVTADYNRRRGGNPGSYRLGMEQTRELMVELGIEHPLSYELHVPLPVRKAGMAEALHIAAERGKSIVAVHKRSLYGNLDGIGGRQIEDVKVIGQTLPIPRSLPVPCVSTGSTSWSGRVGRQLRKRFPEPGPYERKS